MIFINAFIIFVKNTKIFAKFYIFKIYKKISNLLNYYLL